MPVQPKTATSLVSNEKNLPQFGNDDEIQLTNTISEEQPYSVVTLEIHEDTLIPTPMQNHMVIVKGNTYDNESVEGFAYLTSTSGTKTGISGLTGPANPKVADTKASGQSQDQYVIPIIPPVNISSDNCEPLETLDIYINQPRIITVLDDIYEQTSKYQHIVYNTQGILLEQLHELNELHKEITTKANNPVNNAENLKESDFESPEYIF